MVLAEVVEWALHQVTSAAGVSGLQVGLLAVLLVAGYHVRHILRFLQRAVGIAKVASGVGVYVGVLYVVALSFGIVDVSGNAQMLIEGLVGVGHSVFEMLKTLLEVPGWFA